MEQKHGNQMHPEHILTLISQLSFRKKSNDWAQIIKTSTKRQEEVFISKTKDARVSILSNGTEKSDLTCKKKCKIGSLYIS